MPSTSRPLRRKVLLTVLTVLATTLGLTSVLLLWQYAATFRRNTEAEASTVARTIGGTIQTVMLNGRGDLASEVIENLRKAAGIRRIEVYRVNGTEAFKDYVTLMDVVGTLNGRGESELAQELYRNVVQHRGRPGRPRRFADPQLISAVARGGSLSREETLAGESVLTYFLPLRNDRPCQQCHEAESAVRGVVVLSVSTTPIWVGVRQGSLLLGASMGLSALAIAVGLLVSLRRLVVRPLETLVEALRSDDPGAALATVPPSTSAEFTTLVGTLRESVERVRAAQAAMSQSEKLMSLGQLAAGVAHELNNPLAVMTGHAALLLAANPDGPHAQRANRIARAAERCARIVRNFLDLARQHPPERRPVQVNRVVEDALEILAYSLRVNGVEVVTALAPDLPELAADPHQLHQVVVNLVTNAEHAMREVSGPRRLTLVTRQPAFSRVVLEVRDTGPGMSPELQRRIFEPFFTTKPPGHGTGLGLPLCRGIVEGHGGTLTVESAPGHGTTFQVALPAERPAELAEPEVVAAPVPRARILVVDDEPDVAEVLADLLAADGHEVDVAHSGRDALARAKDTDYALILSDMKMPGMDGPALLGELERHQPGLGRRLVFATGDTLSAETQAFLKARNTPVLSKPFDLVQVRAVVRQTLAPGAAEPSA